MTYPYLDTQHRVKPAWTMIQLLNLNSAVQLGDQTVMRYCLVDVQGNAVGTPEEAAWLFDMLAGKAFLPQRDAEWLVQLLTCFRVGLQWSEVLNAWVAEVAGLTHAGPTPGDALVEVLAAAAEAECTLTKHPLA